MVPGQLWAATVVVFVALLFSIYVARLDFANGAACCFRYLVATCGGHISWRTACGDNHAGSLFCLVAGRGSRAGLADNLRGAPSLASGGAWALRCAFPLESAGLFLAPILEACVSGLCLWLLVLPLVLATLSPDSGRLCVSVPFRFPKLGSSCKPHVVQPRFLASWLVQLHAFCETGSGFKFRRLVRQCDASTRKSHVLATCNLASDYLDSGQLEWPCRSPQAGKANSSVRQPAFAVAAYNASWVVRLVALRAWGAPVGFALGFLPWRAFGRGGLMWVPMACGFLRACSWVLVCLSVGILRRCCWGGAACKRPFALTEKCCLLRRFFCPSFCWPLFRVSHRLRVALSLSVLAGAWLAFSFVG